MKAEYHIPGIKNESDAISIKKMLEGTAGVRRATVSVEQGTAQVEFDSQTVTSATLMKKLADLGYQATEGETVR